MQRHPRVEKWRSVVHPKNHKRYASWVLALRGKHGAYLIRDTVDHVVLYAGESHSGQLYETLTRHFQRWKGYTAGTTYRRDEVEVRVKVTRIGRTARALQDRWILRHDPADNVQGKGASNDVASDSTPF